MTSQKNDPTDIKRPSFFLYMTEGFRAFKERIGSYKYRKHYQPKTIGDGHPVMVIPGFMTNDLSTKSLRQFIDRLGYKSYPWTMGRNLGNLETLEDLISRVETLYAEHQQPISLIGWSLGGVYARQISKAVPHAVRQVITLASPFRGVDEPTNVTWVYRVIKKGKSVKDLDQDWVADLKKPTPVPTTSIYSLEDGIVPWAACMELEEDHIHQNLEVEGSHFGLGDSPSVLYIIEDRLKYTEANWVPFAIQTEPKGVLVYPSL